MSNPAVVEASSASGYLVELAGDRPRSEVMKEVVGPVLTTLLEPVYQVNDLVQQARNNNPLQNFEKATEYVDSLVGALDTNLRHRRHDEEDIGPIYEQIEQLIRNRRDLFYYGTAGQVLHEGLATSLVTPFVAAKQIYRQESGIEPEDFAWDTKFPRGAMIKILMRETTAKIIHRLTKGPNGFLGDTSINAFMGMYDRFFEFRHPTSGGKLRIADAFELKDGEVIGLSGLYSLSAQQKRDRITKESIEAIKRSSPHQAHISSGCPMSRQYADEAGKPQNSLINAGKEFLVTALELEPS
jgi:hypothetical protein